MLLERVGLITDLIAVKYKMFRCRIVMRGQMKKSKKDLEKARRVFNDPTFNPTEEEEKILKERVIRMKILLVSRKDKKPSQDKFLQMHQECIDDSMREYIKMADEFFKRRKENGSKTDQ